MSALEELLRLKTQAGERAALSIKHGEPDALFMAREAGPELLEACITLLRFVTPPTSIEVQWVERARAAIVKATGGES